MKLPDANEYEFTSIGLLIKKGTKIKFSGVKNAGTIMESAINKIPRLVKFMEYRGNDRWVMIEAYDLEDVTLSEVEE